MGADAMTDRLGVKTATAHDIDKCHFIPAVVFEASRSAVAAATIAA
jgi:hypothetical protein